MPRPLGLRPAGTVIRDRRHELGLTAGYVAHRVQVSAPHMANVENARRRVSYEVLRRIARVLDMAVEDTIATSESESNRPPGHPPGPRRPEPSRPPREQSEASEAVAS